MKLTERPWRVIPDQSAMPYKIPPDECSVVSDGYHLDLVCERVKNVADAHLIAAAPELYGTLEAIVDNVKGHPLEYLFHNARVALIKARGEE